MATALMHLDAKSIADAIDAAVTGGGYTLPAATDAELGGVKQAPAVADSVATTIAGLVTDFNALLAELRTSGVIASA